MAEILQLVCERCAKNYPQAFPNGLTPHVVTHGTAGWKQCLNCGQLKKWTA